MEKTYCPFSPTNCDLGPVSRALSKNFKHQKGEYYDYNKPMMCLEEMPFRDLNVRSRIFKVNIKFNKALEQKSKQGGDVLVPVMSLAAAF